ncbi:MAG TPA: hypothetical protein VME17_21230 [Bryobacteraceae bacterium]|nr:hypothetical protein [Bryobacteraceae bacterium]
MTAVRVIPAAFLSAALLLASADKTLPIEEATNDHVDVTANAVIDREQIKQDLGYDLGADIILVNVTIRDVSDKPVQISRDDFLLVSAKDGQRSEPFEPGQLAGASSLTVTPTGMRKTRNRPTLGIGLGGIGVGGAQAPNPNDVKVDAHHDENENPVLAVLNKKILQEKQITDTISGQLYFEITGKVKSKDLELRYNGPGGKLALRFKP